MLSPVVFTVDLRNKFPPDDVPGEIVIHDEQTHWAGLAIDQHVERKVSGIRLPAGIGAIHFICPLWNELALDRILSPETEFMNCRVRFFDHPDKPTHSIFRR